MSATMAKFGCGKSAGSVAVTLLSLLLTGIAQPGFLSIDCGGKTNYTDENLITWVTDANYIDAGQTADTRNASLPSYLQSLRYFPNLLNKSCYQLPVVPNVPYLLRLWFAVGNYNGYYNLSTFAFSIETDGLLTMKILTIGTHDPINDEKIFVSSGNVLYICFLKIIETDDPFINAIELRTLRSGMYQHAMPGQMLSLYSRQDFGANSSVRYPGVEFDRLWSSVTDFNVTSSNPDVIQSEEPISTNNTVDLPPSIVMQTAWVASNGSLTFTVPRAEDQMPNSLLLLYFAEIDPLSMSGTRSFYVSINGHQRPQAITLVKNYSALELSLPLSELELSLPLSENIAYELELSLVKATNLSFGPIIDALEYYEIYDTEAATSLEDIEALDAIKTRFLIKSWISDPCYLFNWEGIGCDINNSVSVIRISKVNLSSMNLTGSIPQNIGQLTALVNLSLANNHLTGPLQDFSNLTKLERLHLQNNNLTGSLPDWLFELKNLKELFIENNSFSGVIPSQLFYEPSLNFRYSGNHFGNIRPNPKDRVLLLGMTLSGSLVVALVLIVGFVVYRKTSTRKESSRLYKDNSRIIVPNTAKFCTFTLEEIRAATQNFSQKIGQGGFGFVFFGKLPQGKDVAVKVLSLVSEQGVQEFMNEVDLLSRIHHKNTVSLLGYCNESRELMLVYEHMSGGTLRDHLYGPSADDSQLSWKTRLKIALDASLGLEYLHVGCTPKIIHRDVKTANILLDSTFNAKLADFGLSSVKMDGEVSHVNTTVKGTLGYLDPEYFRTQRLTERSDVYSFGVVLFEIICGRTPINANLSDEKINLVEWVTPYVEMDENRGQILEIVDRRLGGNYDMKSITDIAKLALRCVDARPSSRPSISVVVAEIKEVIITENENNAPLPN